jgi:hypothetical protein
MRIRLNLIVIYRNLQISLIENLIGTSLNSENNFSKIADNFSTRLIDINFFSENYTMRIKAQHDIGDLRKILGL